MAHRFFDAYTGYSAGTEEKFQNRLFRAFGLESVAPTGTGVELHGLSATQTEPVIREAAVTRFFQQVGFAFKCFFFVLFAGRLPDELPARFLRGVRHVGARDDVGVSAVETAGKGGREISGDRAVQVLALLQRDGRLVDFLYEDISEYPDDQVGAAAREVQGSCRDVLSRYLTVEPLVDGAEGRPMMVQPGFDPAQIKIVGNIAGRPPYRGVIRHRGWRAVKVELPALPDGAARSVIAPAEVEVE